ncbi:CcdC family protein [Alicyclobacillus tolerans]|uniref:CcdC family protein n=1 Tax=Alicyclobacillus tolerans TaxID=90970 RepID=UPI003B782FA6
MSKVTAEILSSLIAVVFALTVIFVRVRASRKPTNARKILIPPVAMSTGFLMYIAPQTHEPFLYAVAAFLVGVIFSYPLISTSKMYRAEDGHIYLKRSRGFIAILLILLALRIILHTYVEQYVTILQTGSLFFVLAFGMILPWRIVMYLRYRHLAGQRVAAASESAS